MRCRPGTVTHTAFATVPDQRCTASLSLALHRIRDTPLILAPMGLTGGSIFSERLWQAHPPPGGGRISIIAAAELGEVLPMFKASALNVAVGAVTNKKGARA